MSQIQTEVNCDLCGSVEKSLIKIENGYPISRCRNCSLIYVSRIPEIENGTVMGEYYSGSTEEIESSRRRYRQVSEFLVVELERLRPKRASFSMSAAAMAFFFSKPGKKAGRCSVPSFPKSL